MVPAFGDRFPIVRCEPLSTFRRSMLSGQRCVSVNFEYSILINAYLAFTTTYSLEVKAGQSFGSVDLTFIFIRAVMFVW